MQFGEIKISRRLIQAQREGRLAVFAGAGVSMGHPAQLESFGGIVNEIEERTGIERREASFEQYLGRLESQGVPVHRMTREILTENDSSATDLHRSLLRLFGTSKDVRIVTTNYDLLFSLAAGEMEWDLKVFDAPVLPRGNQFAGLVHIHGSFRQTDDQLVLTDQDFSRAYLTEGWARRFLQQLFSEYIVLFIGYSHGDDVMRYLSRGIPSDSSERRYAFDREWKENGEETDRSAFWEFFGIEASLYPKGKENEHEELTSAVQAWTEFASEKPSDREQHVQAIITQQPTDLNHKDEEYLKELLQSAEGTRYFTRHAETFEWVEWSHEHGYLDPLFRTDSLDAASKEYAMWLPSFLAKKSERALGLVGREWSGLNSQLARQISFRLYRAHKQGEIKPETLSKWILFVLEESSGFPDFLQEVFRKCEYPRDHALALLLMHRATELTADVAESVFHRAETGRVQTYVDLGFIGRPQQGMQFTVEDVWENVFKPHLEQVYSSVEPLVTSRLVEAADIYRASGARWGRYGDLISHRWRDPGADSQIEDTDCLVHMAFDLLEWLLENRSDAALALMRRWSDADAPILNLLAVRGLQQTEFMNADEKINWVLKREWLLEADLHPRSSRLIVNTWEATSKDTRQKVVEYLLGRLLTEDEEEEEYYWFQVRGLVEDLENENDTDTILQTVKETLAGIRDAEGGNSFEGGVHNPEDAVDIADLDLDEDLEFILKRFVPVDDPWEKREAEEILERETRKNPRWTLSLAERLIQEERWEEDIWPYMFTSWRRVEQADTVWIRLLNLLRAHPQVLSRHASSIALLLKVQGDVRCGHLPENCIVEAVDLADTIWDTLASMPLAEDASIALSDQLKRHPMCDLVQFYTEAQLRRGEDRVPRAFRTKMERILEADPAASHAGIYALMEWAPWIHVHDPSWSEKFIEPLLNWENDSRSVAAWTGLLTSGALNEALSKDLFYEFAATFQHLGALENEVVNTLIEVIARAAFSRQIDPMYKGWINGFLKEASEEQACMFAQQVRALLHRSQAEQVKHVWEDWLREYLRRRRDSIPAQLGPDERKYLVRWFGKLQDAFPEAVEIFANQLHSEVSLESRFEVFSELSRSEMGAEYPQSVCSFLRRLLMERMTVPPMHRKNIADLIEQITATDQEIEGLGSLIEQGIRLGCVTARQKKRWLASTNKRSDD